MIFVTSDPADRNKCYLNTDVLTQRRAFIARHEVFLRSVITYLYDKRHFNTIEMVSFQKI